MIQNKIFLLKNILYGNSRILIEKNSKNKILNPKSILKNIRNSNEFIFVDGYFLDKYKEEKGGVRLFLKSCDKTKLKEIECDKLPLVLVL